MITQKLAIFIASSSVPNSIVENEEFRSLILTLDPQYQVPSRTLISVEIDRVLLDLKEKIQLYLMDAQKVSRCVDQEGHDYFLSWLDGSLLLQK